MKIVYRYDVPVNDTLQHLPTSGEQKYDSAELYDELAYTSDCEFEITSNDLHSQPSSQEYDNLKSRTASEMEVEMHEYYNGQTASDQNPSSPVYEVPITE